MLTLVAAAVLGIQAPGDDPAPGTTGAAGTGLVEHRRVRVPEALLGSVPGRDGEPVHFTGDLRIGDLDGDGRADLLAFRAADGGMKPVFLGAFTMAGRPLWTFGDRDAGVQPNRPGPVAIHDLDGDGASEVIALMADDGPARHWLSLENVVLRILDGATGDVEREARPAALRDHGHPGPPRDDPRHWNDANEVHRRILIANFRGSDAPRDFVVKLGQELFAFDEELELLWSYRIPAKWRRYGRHTAYIPAVGDVDGDGRDEVTGGYYLVGPDGEPRWERELGPHMDSVAIAPWDDGRVRVFASGHGCILDATGELLLRLGGELVPHGQELRVADFDAESPGPEMLIRHDGHTPAVRLIAHDGEPLRHFTLNECPNNTGMEAVHFRGPDQPAWIVNGGEVFAGDGTPLGRLPDLPESTPPVAPRACPGWRMAWYHTIPADVCGDAGEEAVVYDPWRTTVHVYARGPVDHDAYRGYVPGPRQWNPRLMD